jgi:hypothetical protein
MEPTIDSVKAIAERGLTDERRLINLAARHHRGSFASGSLSIDVKASKKQIKGRAFLP